MQISGLEQGLNRLRGATVRRQVETRKILDGTGAILGGGKVTQSHPLGGIESLSRTLSREGQRNLFNESSNALSGGLTAMLVWNKQDRFSVSLLESYAFYIS